MMVCQRKSATSDSKELARHKVMSKWSLQGNSAAWYHSDGSEQCYVLSLLQVMIKALSMGVKIFMPLAIIGCGTCEQTLSSIPMIDSLSECVCAGH